MNEEQYGQMQTGVAQPANNKSRIVLALAGVALVLVAGAVWLGMRSSSPEKGNVTLSVRPPATPVQAGSEFTVDILADAAGESLTAADVVVTYDSRIIQGVSIAPGELMPMELAGGALADGKATITVASGTAPASGSGIVARITFRALASGGSDVVLAGGTQAAAVGKSGNVVGHLVPARVTVQ